MTAKDTDDCHAALHTIVSINDYLQCEFEGRNVESEVLEHLGDACVDSFAAFAAVTLQIHRKHRVDDGSYVAHCTSDILRQLGISIVVVVMLTLRDAGQAPAIFAEVLHFIYGHRVGATKWQGHSYYSYVFLPKTGWVANGEGLSGDEGWAQILARRFSETDAVAVTRDGWS